MTNCYLYIALQLIYLWLDPTSPAPMTMYLATLLLGKLGKSGTWMPSLLKIGVDDWWEKLAYTTYWSFGHQEIWAPAMLSLLLVLWMMHALSPRKNERRKYVPKQRRGVLVVKNVKTKITTWMITTRFVQEWKSSNAWAAIRKPIDDWWQAPDRRRKRTSGRSGRHSAGTRSSKLRLAKMPIRGRLLKGLGAFRETRQPEIPREETEHFFDACQEELQAGSPGEVSDEGDEESPPTLIALAAMESAAQHQYDTDSFLIAVDNCCSKSITNQMTDFVSTPVKVNIRVRGIGGNVAATWKGTVRWRVEDDDGQVHVIELPGTYYHADSPYKLLSPQQCLRPQKTTTPGKGEPGAGPTRTR
jgi:hypothetical protein